MAESVEPAVTITKRIRHTYFEVYTRSDGIVVWVSYDKFFTIKEARAFVSALHSITGGVPHLLLVLAGRKSSIDKQGRSYLASPEAMKDIKAMAAVINSTTLRVIANLYLMVDKPVKPVKFFDKADDAVAWLKAESF